MTRWHIVVHPCILIPELVSLWRTLRWLLPHGDLAVAPHEHGRRLLLLFSLRPAAVEEIAGADAKKSDHRHRDANTDFGAGAEPAVAVVAIIVGRLGLVCGGSRGTSRRV